MQKDGKGNKFREFNGNGDFALIPSIESLTLSEITIALEFKTPRACKHRKILASLQHPSSYSGNLYL